VFDSDLANPGNVRFFIGGGHLRFLKTLPWNIPRDDPDGAIGYLS
jgi:hypothetical protein